MTYAIIIITVLISIKCFSSRELFEKLSLRPYRIKHYKEWYRVVTHGFVHGDMTHLLVNMFVLWSFGLAVENLMKAYQYAGLIKFAVADFIILYISALVFSSLFDVLKKKNDPYYNSIGASGAVSAIVFASIFFTPWSKIYLFAIIPIPGILFGIAYLAYEQYMNKKNNDNINHTAHIFGAIYGFIFPIILNTQFLEVFINNIKNFSF